MTSGPVYFLLFLRLVAFLHSGGCWSPMGKAVSASYSQGYLGKCFHYSKMRLLMQEEGA